MSHSLEQQVRAIGRRARRLLMLRGWLSFITVAAAMALAAGIADYALRFQDLGLRIIASSTVLAVAAGAFIHFVTPVIRWRWGDTLVAQHIERRFPELSDQLSTAIAFLKLPKNDPTAGSLALREAAVQETTHAVAHLRLSDCLDLGPFLRSAIKLSVVAIAIAVLVVNDPLSASFAACRLAWPLGHETWPRRNVLMFTKHPGRLATGEDFEVELVDKRARLPERVFLQYRYPGDPAAAVQTKAMKAWGKPVKPWGDRMVCRLENVSRSFEYRAVGGDDDKMDWIRLEVVEPPRIVDLQVYLDPPSYTQLPAEQAGRHIRAWEGTGVRMEGRLDKPLRELHLVSETSQHRRSIRARLAQDGLRFTIPAPGKEPWVLQSSGSYWFDWLDREDYRLREVMRSEIHVQRDAPPAVSIVAPTSESYFTNQALVPLRIVAKDDLALRSVELQYNGTRLELHRTPKQLPSAELGEPSTAERGESLTLDYPWDLGQVPDIGPGDTIEFRVVASDFKPQAGPPASMRIAIISPQELSIRIDQRQATILGQLNEALRLQRTAHSQTTLLQNALEESGGLSADEVDYLQATDLNQRQVQSLLAGEVGGAAQLIRVLLDELRSNRINEPQIADRLSLLQREVTDLGRSQLPQIQSELIRALKSARADLMRLAERGDPASETGPAEIVATGESLSTAATVQGEVIERLEILTGQLTEWESYRQLALDVNRVYGDQETIAEQTAELSTAGMALSALSPRDRAALKRLAHRQTELARTFDRLHSRLRTSREALSKSDPAASAAIDQAMNATRGTAIGGLMREAAGHIDGNRIGQATRLHEELLQGLQGLLDQLDSRRGTPSLDRLQQVVRSILRQQQDAARRTSEVERQRQNRQEQRAADLVTVFHELAEFQDELQAQTLAAAGDVRASDAYRFGLERAARPMQLAATLLRAQISDPRVHEAQTDAIRRMQAILGSIDRGRKRVESPAADRHAHSQTGNETTASLAELVLTRSMQLEINERTVQLDKSHEVGSPWDVPSKSRFDQLAEDQSRLASLAEKMFPASAQRPSSPPSAANATSQSELDKALQAAGIPGFGASVDNADDSAEGGRTVEKEEPRRSTGDDIGQPSSEDPIGLRIVSGMRSAEENLRSGNASSQTQGRQQNVLADLDLLIESLSQVDNEQNAGQSPEENTDPEAGESPGGDPGHSPSAISMSELPSAKTNEGTENESANDLMIRVWGQLPAHLQEQIQSPAREEFLPEYERLIIEYYRRLAEIDVD